jgi:putative mRNA 3-end processing factor
MYTRLLELTPAGLYCPRADVYIDPWRPVPRAIVTHAHSDHARPGSGRYLAATEGESVLRDRLGEGISLDAVAYGETVTANGVHISVHPAGHIFGSAQVRLEHQGEVCVVSGDYKVEPDPTCTPFEPVRCHTFVTESTFGLPVYRWDPQQDVFAAINQWWRTNAAAGKCSILYAYALGKAQRLLHGLDPSIGPIVLHGAIERLTRCYREAGVTLPPTQMVMDAPRSHDWAGSMVIAPPSAGESPWLKRFEPYSAAQASGWMRIRGVRRRRGYDRGFVLSDHADWPGLLTAIRETRAENVLITHGNGQVLKRWLLEQGLRADVLETHFGSDEADDPGEPLAAEEAGA